MDFLKIKKSPILLKEENKQYAFDKSKEMRGYVKLEKSEDKGLIVAAMDNIKFFPKGEYVYKLIFARQRNGRLQYHLLGSMSLSAYGKGEGSFRINPKDLDGSGTAVWDFSTAIIAAMSTVNSREPLHPVLKGNFSLTSEQGADKRREAEPRDYSPFYSRFVLENCIAIAKKQNEFEDVVPFSNTISGISWKRIDNITFFPIVSPGARKPIEKYEHFLFGWNDSHYFIGVTGRFLTEEQPDKGKSGFAVWFPIFGMEDTQHDETISIDERRKNVYGYWLAAVNRYNGHIEEFPLIEK